MRRVEKLRATAKELNRERKVTGVVANFRHIKEEYLKGEIGVEVIYSTAFLEHMKDTLRALRYAGIEVTGTLVQAEDAVIDPTSWTPIEEVMGLVLREYREALRGSRGDMPPPPPPPLFFDIPPSVLRETESQGIRYRNRNVLLLTFSDLETE